MTIKWAYFFDLGTFEINLPLCRTGVGQGPGILVQSLFYLTTSMVLVMEHMRMLVEFRICDNGQKNRPNIYPLLTWGCQTASV